ncbi:MAG: multifunctional CCA tRNA nucleotidyl transferase/2'3'-cyclic phosphodiesterase/2'nucleotidase/phosphatase, partial [Gammaproteobacteria bacterium]|nr:multifunctional CCA tRNA nucleotidyl transferase/2'3'-cyclic phosphodiesterase/2'nucleotidase/phosphatase [Gammaproteobacteria bacterium]
QFLLACEADSRGRLGLENIPYPQAGLLAKALEASNKVDARQFVEQGYKDAEIGEQVRIKRLQLISVHLNQ